MNDEILTPDEIAKHLKCSKRYVSDLFKKGLPYTQLTPRVIRTLKSRLFEFIKENEVKPDEHKTEKGTLPVETKADKIAEGIMKDFRKKRKGD
ncbi:Uncharacterized protein dnl_63210 [Desulfonema limicola]|uniref:Helix-turn-helix domain-containing protein n=1 Tax=Desulfonema limicola TaxID=45656 RepID=A0A975BEG8_9BACT|nr:hypothetical protein [Desulfonema limicola]QTA83897.1 Uncharacterized protein dnl_63210 [Desulfonema limicola]